MSRKNHIVIPKSLTPEEVALRMEVHEISMKLQKTNTKKIEKTATRVAVFNL